ncbi:MAG: DUF222 domain-containing protein [Acidimicrobiales bacterium]|nr:DUF222 domain-containing protein [Acidimicrobiales bacterium]
MMFGADVCSEVEAVGEHVAALCAALDPGLVGDHEIEPVFDALVAMGKRIDGAVVRLTARYEAAGAWKHNGERSAADDVARKTGTSPATARRRAETSKRLAELSDTDRAVADGELSSEQAEQVASGASASPDDEGDLLDSARKEPLPALRRKAAQSRARADRDRTARQRRLHARRRVSRWIDDDGLYNLLTKLTPELGAEIDAFLKPRIDQRYADARHAGRYESYEAYAADVIADLLTGRAQRTTTSPGSTSPDPAAPDPASAGSTPPDEPPSAGQSKRSSNPAVRPDRKVIATIDLHALNRGRVTDGETCEIAGVGPVPVPLVRSMLSDAFLTLVIKDGVDIIHVTHLGRQVTAHQRSALEARGYRCEVDGCGSTHHLEIDHVTGWTLTETTTVDDLAWLCAHHHDRKTRENLILEGPTGHRRLVPRTGPARAANTTTSHADGDAGANRLEPDADDHTPEPDNAGPPSQPDLFTTAT